MVGFSTLNIGVDNFQKAFSFIPKIFGMGDLALSYEPVARLLNQYGFNLDISDLNSYKYAVRDNIKMVLIPNSW